jgi:membrane protease YdiL (CAAX protease family)
MMNAETQPLGARDWTAVITAIVLPSVITWIYFFQAEGAKAGAQVAIFGVVKVLQFALPVVWVFFVQRSSGREPSANRVSANPEIDSDADASRPPRMSGVAGVLLGLAFGALVAAAMMSLYFAVLRGSALLAAPSEEITAKIAGWNIDTAWKYALLGVFYSLVHSFLEEYYWRWFVFGQLRRSIALSAAIAISSLGFMAHHVLVLGKFFGFDHWATYVFSACVAIGGAVWAWLYQRSGSLRGPWLSHLLVDAAIFAIGYDLVKHLFAA